MRKIVVNTKDPVDGKLGPNLEGPYKIVKLDGKGAYYLEDSESKQAPRPWNSNNLKKYFHESITIFNRTHTLSNTLVKKELLITIVNHFH